MAEKKSQTLRAAGYCRTSTEGQRDNTSIPTQKSAIERFINIHTWKFMKHYVDESRSGSKIEGRDEFQQMMRDAANGKFDVLVVYDMTRYSRDGKDIIESTRTLFREFGIKVVDVKGSFDSSDPHRTVTNFVFAGISEAERFSILDRTKNGKIRKAKEDDAPVVNGNKLPHGRIWHKAVKKWSVDRERQAVIVDAAKRYLAGESMHSLAKEVGMAPSNFYWLLKEKGGDRWIQHIRCKELGIDESIPTKIPRLLSKDLMKSIQKKIEENKTYCGRPKYKYLLNGFIFCKACGYRLSGQPNKSGRLYYRHTSRTRNELCPCKPRVWIRADEVENSVMDILFETFGNRPAIRRAIEKATPNLDEAKELRKREKRTQTQLKSNNDGYGRILDLVAKGTISQEKAQKKLIELEERESKLRDELERIQKQLSSIPDKKRIEDAAMRTHNWISKYAGEDYANMQISDRKIGKLRAEINLAMFREYEMNFEDKRTLIESVFRGKNPCGQPNGVYVDVIEGQKPRTHKKWKIHLHGELVDDIECVAGIRESSPTESRYLCGWHDDEC